MEKDMNKTAENRRNAAESVLNGGIEYSAFEKHGQACSDICNAKTSE